MAISDWLEASLRERLLRRPAALTDAELVVTCCEPGCEENGG
jgi:hypothetical protein